MKKLKVMALAMIGIMLRSVSCNADVKMAYAKKLPKAAKNFVQRNFPQQAIANVEKSGNSQQNGYVVNLSNGTQMLFNNNGQWDVVDCKSQALPMSLIPAKALNVIDRRFNNAQFVKIAKTLNGCELTLSNGVIMHVSSL